MSKALDCYDRVLREIPNQLDAVYFKALILLKQGNCEKVTQLLSPLLETDQPGYLKPMIAKCHRVFGSAVQTEGNTQEALNHYLKCWNLDPEQFDYAADVIQAYLALNQPDQASDFARELPPLAFTHTRCLAALAEIEWKSWNIPESLRYLQLAMKQSPGRMDLISQYLFTLNYLPDDGPEVARQHVAIGQALASVFDASRSNASPQSNHQTSSTIRIGFLSPDLREHPVSTFLLPLLRELHQKPEVWVACYALNSKLDPTSNTIRSNCDEFKHITQATSLDTIAADHLDFLVDLAGHSAGNAMPLLLASPKPAISTINWLGYANTTGFNYHDYRIVDSNTDPTTLPANEIEPIAERRVYIPDSFICYEKPDVIPEVGELPAITNGYITIGCLNNLNKITPDTLDLWARLLKDEPGFHLLVKSRLLDSTRVRSRFLRPFEQIGVQPERIKLLSWSPDSQSHLETYRKIDFTLDTFPYNGTTTTFESLMMGCPVITIEGKSHRARVSTCILKNLGKDQWIAKNPDAYLEIARQLGHQIQNLEKIRLGLRHELFSSSLCNASQFAEKFIQALSVCKKNFKTA